MQQPRFRLALAFVALTSLVALPALSQEAPNTQAADSFPHLQLATGAPVYQASVDLRRVELPMLGVSNPSRDAFVTIEVLAHSAAGGHVRSHLIHLEPGGSTTLGFETKARLSSVSVLSAGAFTAELLSGARGKAQPITISEGPLVGSRFGFGDDPRFCFPRCDKDWKLTCNSGGCAGLGPFTEPGRVLCDSPVGNANQVYWKLNVPTGPWTTVGDQGITATWSSINAFGCPTSVTNSLGHTYDITFP